jgi:hypothetical protein
MVLMQGYEAEERAGIEVRVLTDSTVAAVDSWS